MDDILAIAGIAATVGIVAGLALVLRWILVDRGDPATLASIYLASTRHDWPVGVQEEEPFRWRVEELGLDHRGPVVDPDQTIRRASASNAPRTAPG
jgi:hypothetical protein